MHDANAVTTIELDVGFLDLSCKEIPTKMIFLYLITLNSQICTAR